MKMKQVEIPWPKNNAQITVTYISNRDEFTCYHFRTPAVIALTGSGSISLKENAPNACQRNACVALVMGNANQPIPGTRSVQLRIAPVISIPASALKPNTDYFFNVEKVNADYARSFQVQVTLQPPK